MRIGIVSPYSFSIPGGVNQQVLTHAKALAGKGHQVFVMGPGQLSQPQGFTFYSIGETVAFPFANGSTANICLKLNDPKAILKFISDQKIQVIHMHEPLMPYANWFLLNRVTIPVLGTFHAFAQKNIPYQLMGWHLKKYFRKLSAVTAVSGPAHSMVSKFFNSDAKTQISVIPNCVSLSVPQPSVTNQFDWLRDGKKNILFLGRFEKRKGLDVLLDAVSGGVFHEKNIRLVVVGSGKTTHETESVIANATQKLGDRVAFLGKLNDADLSKVFEMSHVFVAPSLGGESFGVILLEAIRAKIPVVASDIDGYRWVLEGEKYGLLSAPGDSKMLAQTIDKLLKDEALRNTLISESQKRLKMFDVNFVIEKYVNQYESLVNASLSVDKSSKK